MSKKIHAPEEPKKDIWVGTRIDRAIRDTLRLIRDMDNDIQERKV